MPADRDQRRRIITPPKGVTPPAGQRTEEQPESWEDAGHETPMPVDPVESLHVIGRRVKATVQNSQATLDEMSKLRGELDQMREAGGRREGKLEQVLAAYAEERKERQKYTDVGVAAYQAGIDVEVKRALAKIELDKNQAAATIVAGAERAAYWRAIGIKVLAGVAIAWGALMTYLHSR